MEAVFSGVGLECIKGDIAKQEGFDAVVNAANAQLRTGGGVAGAIHRAAGPKLEEECRPLAPIRVGEAVITGGHDLPNRYVIHCLGPVCGMDEPFQQFLRDCYVNTLQIADQHEVKSIAFPAISTGAFGCPMEEAAEVALRAVVETAGNLNNVKKIRFVLNDERSLEIYEQIMSKLVEEHK